MTCLGQSQFFAAVFRSAIAVLIGMAVLPMIAAPAAQAQTYTVIHSFTGGADGGNPEGGLIMDAAGNLYGTTLGEFQRCGDQCGTVFKMKNTGQGWILTPLYKFSGTGDGANPHAGVVFGPDGALYGTTEFGGLQCPSDDFNEVGCGTVFRLAPPPTVCKTALCPWGETVLYSFLGSFTDGAFPLGRVAFDQSGNIYGTALSGGDFAECPVGAGWCGAIFKLTHSNGAWTETVPHIFTGGSDGGNPIAGLTANTAGNFYGVAAAGANGNGTIFELTASGLDTLYALAGESSQPQGDLIFDPAGNFYGTTADGDNGGGSAVFEMMPSGGGWNFSLVYSLGGFLNGDGPNSGVVRDSAGNLYGTALALGSNNVGLVFKLTPSDGGWTYTVLHEFATGDGGDYPIGGLVLDGQGNLYGTTTQGGAYGWGVVWEITP